MMKTILVTLILAFGGAQAFAGPCSLRCELKNVDGSAHQMAKKSVPQSNCHDENKQENQSSNNENKSDCLLQVCAISTAKVIYGEINVPAEQAEIAFDLSKTIPEIKLLPIKLVGNFIPDKDVRVPKNPLYIQYKNLKLPS